MRDAERLGAVAAHRQRIGIFEAERAEDEHAVARAQLRRSSSARIARAGGMSVRWRMLVQSVPPIIDIDVDIARRERLIGDGRAEIVAPLGAVAGGAAAGARSRSARIYCSEKFLAPITTVSPPAPAPARAAKASASAAASRPSPADDRASASAAPAPASTSAKQPVDDERQRRRGRAADQHAHPVLGLQAGEDEVAEARLADRGRERRRADRPDRGGADAGEDHRRAERQLDQAQALAPGHADAVRGLEHAGSTPSQRRRRRSAGSAAGHRG